MSLKSIWKMLTIMVLVCAPMSTLYLTFWGESQARHLQTMSSPFHHHHRRSYCESGPLFKYLGVHIAHNLTRTTFTALQEKGPPTPRLEEAETCWLQCGHPDCLLQIWCGEHPHILYHSLVWEQTGGLCKGWWSWHRRSPTDASDPPSLHHSGRRLRRKQQKQESRNPASSLRRWGQWTPFLQ